jgi:hypothetical protein
MQRFSDVLVRHGHIAPETHGPRRDGDIGRLVDNAKAIICAATTVNEPFRET